MNLEKTNRASRAASGFIVGSLIFIVLFVAVRFSSPVPPIDAGRNAIRARALAEMRSTEEKSLTSAGWIDQSRGIVRLPIDAAMQQAAQAWKNPAQARADLISRQENASKPVPVAPAKPSAFE